MLLFSLVLCIVFSLSKLPMGLRSSLAVHKTQIAYLFVFLYQVISHYNFFFNLEYLNDFWLVLDYFPLVICNLKSLVSRLIFMRLFKESTSNYKSFPFLSSDFSNLKSCLELYSEHFLFNNASLKHFLFSI